MDNNKVNPVVLVLLAVLLIGAGAFGVTRLMGNSSVSPTAEVSVVSPTQTPEGTPMPTSSDTTSSEVKVINIQAGSFFYNPAEIKVKKGEKVKIVMESKDMMHDFVIEELNVKLPITKAGETNEITFTADKVGKFEYYCSVGNHRQMGQKGTLIVE